MRLLLTRLCRPSLALFSTLAMFAAAQDTGAAAGGRLRVDLVMPKAKFTATEAVARWMLDADGVDASHLRVTQNGALVPYLGARVKRRAPTSEDTLTLAPGETRTATFDLALFFDMRTGGDYQVNLSPTLASRVGSSADLSTAPNSASTAFTAAGRAERAGAAPSIAAVAAASPGECTASDREIIATSANAARNYVRDSLRYLGGTPPLGERYLWWFGPNDSARRAVVTATYTNMLQKFDTRAPRYSCSPTACGSGVFAYVFPSDSTHTVHLCSAFWAAPFTGTDSRAGTLVHEMSHFDSIGSTDDYAYGQTAAHALVTAGNYTQAIHNADSHEYFSENTPARP
jgi:peptidyl-Lys metalloendopeptidase